ADTTIWIAPGTYNMGSYLHIIHNGIALRGQTGSRDDVILDFGGMVGGEFGILVDADDVTISDLTIRNAAEHGVSVQARDRTILYNLHILDINNQLVKVNPTIDRSRSSEDGLLACSRLEYTTTAPDNYTNGISAHDAHGWVVRDNEWVRILTSDGTPVPAVLFWNNSSDTIVERNFFLDCGRGVAFGLNNGHTGGIVRNNMFLFREPHDVAIEMADATGWLVAHNTAVLLNPAPGLTWGMEARFGSTSGSFVNNLTNMSIWTDRDGALATSSGDITNAQTSWFVDALNGDLHLAAGATAVIDQASPIPQVTDDFDRDTRPIGSAPDMGADEYGVAPPTAVTDLRISQAI
ncbi:MAG: right-handed parallel beta-helix repeat-containing protein, partial [Anaerolineales bacterium]|nr:right-handed parallel beta-helix repeat-containing protein [Anaerolineales bacterium]